MVRRHWPPYNTAYRKKMPPEAFRCWINGSRALQIARWMGLKTWLRHGRFQFNKDVQVGITSAALVQKYLLNK